MVVWSIFPGNLATTREEPGVQCLIVAVVVAAAAAAAAGGGRLIDTEHNLWASACQDSIPSTPCLISLFSMRATIRGSLAYMSMIVCSQDQDREHRASAYLDRLVHNVLTRRLEHVEHLLGKVFYTKVDDHRLASFATWSISALPSCSCVRGCLWNEPQHRPLEEYHSTVRIRDPTIAVKYPTTKMNQRERERERERETSHELVLIAREGHKSIRTNMLGCKLSWMPSDMPMMISSFLQGKKKVVGSS